MPRLTAIARRAATLFIVPLVLFSCASLDIDWASTCPAGPANSPGGFVESAASTAVRPALTATQIGALLPNRGTFNFPAPYLTTGIRITNSGDCGGTDCVLPVGYSYWRNINNHTCSDKMLIFLGLDPAKGGSGPTLFEYHKPSGTMTKVGPLFPQSNPLHYASGEGWYFSATQPTSLYLMQDTRLRRYDVNSSTFETVFDAAPAYGSNKYIWQAHSSDDDRVHSATLRDLSTSAMLGCVVYREETQQFSYYPTQGVFDECHVDKSGHWLLILDNVDGSFGEDNRIIDLDTGVERLLLDQNGAAGHADMGYGYMLAEDNWGAFPGMVRLWKFDQPLIPGPGQGVMIYHTTSWSADVGHLAHGNATSGPPGNQVVCSSNATSLALPRSNEIVCYRADSSLATLVVAPVMTDMNASGGGDSYSKRPKGNLDVTGQYFIWTSNMSGNRLDAFLVRVPSQLLVGAADATPPAISNVQATAIGSVQASIAWTTDEPADSGVDYGPTTAYGNSTPLNAALVTVHSQVLTGLSPGTPYHYRVRSRDAAGNQTISSDHLFQTTPASGAGPQSAIWTNVVHCTANGGSLQKTSGGEGLDDARAVSSQQLSASGGYLEFTAVELGLIRLAGLSAGAGGGGWASIDFAIRLGPASASTGIADVREKGVWKADTPFVTGDKFRIAVESGVVRYYKNAVPFYTSTKAPAYPLRADIAIFSVGGTIQNGVILQGPAAGPPGEVTGVRFISSNTMQWNQQPTAVEYHVYRGGLAQLPGGIYGSCRDDLDGNRTDLQLIDSGKPASQGSFIYLITAESAGGQEGPLGYSSLGAQENNSAPCN
jgi:hypothetical protein